MAGSTYTVRGLHSAGIKQALPHAKTVLLSRTTSPDHRLHSRELTASQSSWLVHAGQAGQEYLRGYYEVDGKGLSTEIKVKPFK